MGFYWLPDTVHFGGYYFDVLITEGPQNCFLWMECACLMGRHREDGRRDPKDEPHPWWPPFLVIVQLQRWKNELALSEGLWEWCGNCSWKCGTRQCIDSYGIIENYDSAYLLSSYYNLVIVLHLLCNTVKRNVSNSKSVYIWSHM